MQQQNTKATRSDDGESRYTADEDHDEGSSCISKGSKGSRATLSERSGSVASSRVSHKAREGAGGKGMPQIRTSLDPIIMRSRPTEPKRFTLVETKVRIKYMHFSVHVHSFEVTR